MPRELDVYVRQLTQCVRITETVFCRHFCRIVFEDAAGLGFADVARELLLISGCAILLDRPCPLDMVTLRLLLGCSVPWMLLQLKGTQRSKDRNAGVW